jgi:hypothetical protein
MLVVGILNVFQRLAALSGGNAYGVTLGGPVVVFNVTAWRWIQLIFGIVLVIVAVLLARGSTFARVVAMILVALNLIAQFGWAPLYSFLALIVVAIDVVVLYALAVHGGALKT